MTISIKSGKQLQNSSLRAIRSFCKISTAKLTAKASYCSIHYLKGSAFFISYMHGLFDVVCTNNSNTMCVRIQPQTNVAQVPIHSHRPYTKELS